MRFQLSNSMLHCDKAIGVFLDSFFWPVIPFMLLSMRNLPFQVTHSRSVKTAAVSIAATSGGKSCGNLTGSGAGRGKHFNL